MREQRSPHGQSDDARVQRAIVNLIVDADRQRPFSEAELARATGDPTAAALAELYRTGIIHRWQQLISATHPAVRYHELAHGKRADPEDRHDHMLLELVLETTEHGVDEAALAGVIAAENPRLEIDVLDALDRLDRAGLIERRGQQVYPAPVVIHLDALSL